MASQAEDVLYVAEYNHQKERHLPGGSLDQFSRPTVLIAPARSPRLQELKGRPQLAHEMTQLVKGSIGRKGDVLIPTDAAGRSLELLCVLEYAWRADRR